MTKGPSLKTVRRFRYRINPAEEFAGRDWFAYHINRPVSLFLTWLFLQTDLSANSITIMQLIVGLAAATAIAWGSCWLRLAGVGMLYAGFLLDHCDGEVARFRNQVSITGKFLDEFAHHVVNSSLMASIGVVAWRLSGRAEALVLGFAAGIAAQRVDLSLTLAHALRAIRAPIDQRYPYYAAPSDASSTVLIDDLQGQFKKGSSGLRRLIFGVFAYPGIMHILLLLAVMECTLRAVAPGTERFPWLVAVWIYGLCLPFRRVFTVRAIVTRRIADHLFLESRNEEERE